MAKMTLYHHFASKDELIVAVIEKLDGDIRTALTAAMEAAGRSPSRRLLAVFDWLKVWFESADFKGCAFIRALSEYPDPAHPIHRAAWHHKEAVQNQLTQLATEAEATRPFVIRGPAKAGPYGGYGYCIRIVSAARRFCRRVSSRELSCFGRSSP